MAFLQGRRQPAVVGREREARLLADARPQERIDQAGAAVPDAHPVG
jgi:hypothetical protein